LVDNSTTPLAGSFLNPNTISGVTALHATCMFLTWLVIIPIAILFASPMIRARLFGGDIYANPRYTLAHKIAVGFASIVMIVGYATGYFIINTGDAPVHCSLGSVVAFMVILQSVMGAWRSAIQTRTYIPPTMVGEKPVPAPLTPPKRIWGAQYKNTIATVHAWTGRTVWVLAVANIFVGFQTAGYDVSWQIISGFMVAVALVPIAYGPIMSMIRR